MTRRTRVAVLGGVAVLVAVILLIGLARSVLPSSSQARESAQAAADRVAPGQVRVTSAHWRGEAGGYLIDATLTNPPRTISWDGDRECAPGSECEELLRLTLAAVRDSTAAAPG